MYDTVLNKQNQNIVLYKRIILREIIRPECFINMLRSTIKFVKTVEHSVVVLIRIFFHQ